LHILVISRKPQDPVALTLSFPEQGSNVTHIKQVSPTSYFVMVGIEEDLEPIAEKILSNFA
jgi:hypothetical protein